MSVSLAANELRVTPAAISHQIRILEDQLGLPLFVRNGRGAPCDAERFDVERRAALRGASQGGRRVELRQQ
jgi:DNA-binding transcriptional LysR family regulator